MNQLSLLNPVGTLPNGQQINIGDVCRVQCGPYVGFRKVFESDGYLCVIGVGPHCFKGSIAHFLEQDLSIKKVTPKEVYMFCKEHRWNSAIELALFK